MNEELGFIFIQVRDGHPRLVQTVSTFTGLLCFIKLF